jgi:phosphoinositide 3-/4-kinase-like protein
VADPKNPTAHTVLPVEGGSGGDRVVMAEPAGEELSKRLARQNRGIARLLKDPANDEAAKGWRADPKRRTPMMRTGGGGVITSAAAYDGMDTDSRTAALLHRMEGREVFGTNGPARGLNTTDLFRSYKHTPHQPASVFLKYLVHRINHLDEYEDPVRGVGLDVEFLKHHQKGDASRKNGHLAPQDFHVWMHTHPTMPEQLLVDKAKLHAELSRGVGLNIRDIAGTPHVALTRGLKSDIMDHEHALSSWSDLVNSGFGSYMHHAWVPLKDLWYSYQFGDEEAGGDAGHENEYLVSHTGPRFEAEPHDVKSVRGHGSPHHYDNATDDELAETIKRDSASLGSFLTMKMLKKPGAGQKTLEAALYDTPGRSTPAEADLLTTKFRTREQAMASPLPSSVENPGLTKDDLHAKVLQLSQANTLTWEAADGAMKHPNATSDTARTLVSQNVPGREFILDEVARSPLAPPDVLDKVVEAYRALPPGSRPLAVTYLLSNPNHTSAQADTIARLDAEKGNRMPEWFLGGRYSPQLIQEMSDQVGMGYGQEPHHATYLHGTEDKRYKTDLDKFLAAKARFANVYNGLVQMAGNSHLDDDATEALLEAIQRHKLSDGLRMMVGRQQHAPMSEVSQLRLLRALNSGIATTPGATQTTTGDIKTLAGSRGLAPSMVWALALHPNHWAREALYQNRSVDPEVLAQAWPANKPPPDEYASQVYRDTPGIVFERRDPYYELARAIVDRRGYAERRAATHLVRPWPKDLAKSEEGWWPVKLREWMSKRAKGPEGYFLRVPNLDQARAIVKDRVLPLTPTDEVLDGYVVLAHPAKDHYLHAWENDPEAGAALVYFETDEPPLHHDGLLYWPHEVHATEARIAGIRPTNQLAKAETDLKKMALIHDDPAKPRTVWRVQNEKGAGPYAGGSNADLSVETYESVMGRPRSATPTPTSDFVPGESGLLRDSRMSKLLRFGFEQPEHAKEWFGADVLGHMESEGFKLMPVPAAQVWRSKTGKQVMFVPHDASQGRKFGGKLAKNEPLTRGPAFNGEKDYRPDESGDPKFPFMGGARKEATEADGEGLKLPGSDLEAGEHRTALAQLGHNDRFELLLAAACFLARKRFDPEKFQQGLAVYGDETRAALHAVDLADSEKNLRALEAVVVLQGGKAQALSKAEAPQPISIRSIQPGNEDGVDASEAIERAVRGNTIVPLKLNGKHSKGAMAARDPRTGRVWLLKPGSGKQSPAAGARDGTASQSRREAAFWHVADELHLGGVVPRADLLIVNAQEWAAIKLLGRDWKSLDERNREKQYKGREVLGPYLSNGQLHRWAILDWVLGNTDSHGQNLLVNEGGSVALIDHGAAFAGEHFDPAHDTKSFIPFYLRVWAPEADFKKLLPVDRIRHMPTLGRYEDDVLKRWLVEDFTPDMLERIARKYGIDEKVLQACLARLQELRSAPGNLSRTVNALWAGAPVPKPDETPHLG